ncbi:hypothetical protein [Dactylosporangium sp. NPDC051541]|uniref:hypothetical protein n=1 Tax=Dactylosporangium sp. NPDC051541 TaxID=3363977 RepID=UPI00378FD762
MDRDPANLTELVDALRTAGRNGEAIDWARRALKAKAGRPHTEQLRQRVADQPAYVPELVDVLTATGAHDEAWQAATTAPNHLGRPGWIALLEKRRTTNPADVIEPYQQLIETQVNDNGDKHRYRRAVLLLASLQEACQAAGQQNRFTAYLTDFRDRHRRRPTLIKTLDSAGFHP